MEVTNENLTEKEIMKIVHLCKWCHCSVHENIRKDLSFCVAFDFTIGGVRYVFRSYCMSLENWDLIRRKYDNE